MPFRSSIRIVPAVAALAVVTLTAIPAQAQSSPPPMGASYAPTPAQPQIDQAAWERARADWLDECRYNRRHDRRGNTLGGALIGGATGAILGNAVAGRGDKALGTVAGAVIGGAAGGAIGHSADRRQERRAMDFCESYLERHMGYGYAQPGYGFGYAYQQMTVMVPVALVQTQQAAPTPAPRECTETQVIEEWVPAGGAKRLIPPRKRVPSKRVPDKRIPIG